MKPLKIIIAGGGTGGHLFPGIAIANRFKQVNSENNITFVSIGNKFERSVLSKTEFELKTISAHSIKGGSLKRRFASAIEIPRTIAQSVKILQELKPDIVIGMGGYASGAVVLSACLLRIKTAIHEQNIIMGAANKILSRFADKIYLSFQHTAERIKKKNILVTGNPVRKEILQTAEKETIKQKDKLTILVLGGSQGAKSINNAMTQAVSYLREKQNLFIIHQTGRGNETQIEKVYLQNGISCLVKPFFDDMEVRYSESDLVICRAGATTVAEITAIGKPAVFIPFPFAADNHQELNAKELTELGAALMVLEKDLSGIVLSRIIENYISNPRELENIGNKLKRYGKNNAAELIVGDCYKTLEL